MMPEKFWAHMEDGKTPRCQENVYHVMGNWGQFSQCSRAAKVRDRCTQHSPEAVAARRAKSAERFEAESRSLLLGFSGRSLLATLREIAGGAPNPRKLAREAIKELDQ